MRRDAALHRLSLLFLITGAGALIWCVVVLGGTTLFNRYEEWQLSRHPQTVVSAPLAAAKTVHEPPAPHSVIGRLEIPRLNISTVVVEGDSARDLRFGAGHIPGTAFPDETGNFAVAAHRDRAFRPLRNIVANDRITVDTPEGIFHYSVLSTEIVDPTDVGVLRAPPGTTGLVLVTCYPFNYLGSAPLRFIVHARRVS